MAERSRTGTLTLVYSARDAEHNNALVLKSTIEKKLREFLLDKIKCKGPPHSVQEAQGSTVFSQR